MASLTVCLTASSSSALLKRRTIRLENFCARRLSFEAGRTSGRTSARSRSSVVVRAEKNAGEDKSSSTVENSQDNDEQVLIIVFSLFILWHLPCWTLSCY